MGNGSYSYSRVSTFSNCPFQYKCKYVDRLEPIKDYDADNALIIGTAMHNAIEGIINWEKEYLSNLYVSSDKSEDEIIKIEVLSQKAREWLNSHFKSLEFEREIKTPDGYIGYIDCIAIDDDNRKWILDFKYSNSEYYLKSPQIHIYKYIVEKFYGEKIDNIAYYMIPKSKIRQKKDETPEQFKSRLWTTISDLDIKVYKVRYEPEKVADFFEAVAKMKSAKEFPKKCNNLCDFCDYKKLCMEGKDIMLIPKNEKVEIKKDDFKKVFLYGVPFSGKTYLANSFEDALLLNSDGNTKYVNSPRIHICDEVTMEGRIEKRKMAWELFKEVITELEQGNGKEYKTIVVDLIEDMYEYCRLYMYKKLNISHESDDSFKAWDKVRQEFLGTIKKLVSLPFNIVIISQEDSTRDITARGGDKITSIVPALNEKVARKLAGMVDIVLRVVNDNGTRTLQNKCSDVVFGGGRLPIKTGVYPCSYNTIEEMYNTLIVEDEE